MSTEPLRWEGDHHKPTFGRAAIEHSDWRAIIEPTGEKASTVPSGGSKQPMELQMGGHLSNLLVGGQPWNLEVLGKWLANGCGGNIEGLLQTYLMKG